MQKLEIPAGFYGFCHALDLPDPSQDATLLMHPLEVFDCLTQSFATTVSGDFACLHVQTHRHAKSPLTVVELRVNQLKTLEVCIRSVASFDRSGTVSTW